MSVEQVELVLQAEPGKYSSMEKVGIERLVTEGGYEVLIPEELGRVILPLDRTSVEIGQPSEEEGSRWPVRRNPRIEIVAPMRMGKTTLSGVLDDSLSEMGLRTRWFKEDWRKNKHLAAAHAGDPEAILASQLWFAGHAKDRILSRDWTYPAKKNVAGKVRFNPRERYLRSSLEKGVSIYEVSPENNLAYALANTLLGLISPQQFDLYQAGYQVLGFGANLAPDLVIQLTTGDDNVYLDRVRRSMRDIEGGLDTDFYLTLKAAVKRVIDSWSATKLIIPTDDFDFANDLSKQKQVVAMVMETLKKIGWEWKDGDGRTKPYWEKRYRPVLGRTAEEIERGI